MLWLAGWLIGWRRGLGLFCSFFVGKGKERKGGEKTILHEEYEYALTGIIHIYTPKSPHTAGQGTFLCSAKAVPITSIPYPCTA